MKTKVFACFTALGKTYASTKLNSALDLESTLYKWVYLNNYNVEQLKGSTDRVLNKHWPQNYINEILKNIGKYEFIFISLNVPEIFNELEKMSVEYKIILPKEKSSIIKRLEQRNNNQEFILSINQKFEEIISYYKEFKNVVYLDKDQFLLDYIKKNHTYV